MACVPSTCDVLSECRDEYCLKLGFSYLSGTGLCLSSGVCRHWRAITDSDVLWRQVCERDYPVLLQIKPMTVSVPWKTLYANRYKAVCVTTHTRDECYPKELAGFRLAVEIIDRVTREHLSSKLIPFGWCDFDDSKNETLMLTEGLKHRFCEPIAGPRPKVMVKQPSVVPGFAPEEFEACFWELTAFVVRIEDGAFWMIGSQEPGIKLEPGNHQHREHFRDTPYCEPDNWADHERVANLWDHELYMNTGCCGERGCELHVYVELDPPDLCDLHELQKCRYSDGFVWHTYDEAKLWQAYKGQEQGGYPGYASIVSVSAHLRIDGEGDNLSSRSEFISLVTSGKPFD